MADSTALARGIHALQDDEHRRGVLTVAAAVGKKPLLQLIELIVILGEAGVERRFIAVEARRCRGINRVNLKIFASSQGERVLNLEFRHGLHHTETLFKHPE